MEQTMQKLNTYKEVFLPAYLAGNKGKTGKQSGKHKGTGKHTGK